MEAGWGILSCFLNTRRCQPAAGETVTGCMFMEKGTIRMLMDYATEYFAGFTTGAVALRLILATVLGGIIGLERATKHHPAGMRTFALVCLGAAASSVANIYLGFMGEGSADLSRIPAGVVSGIGFLGVGTIIITGKNQVRGLTTAAGLWTTATLGIMLGSGMLEIGLLTFAMIFVTMFGIARISRVQEQHNRYVGLYMEIDKSRTRGIYDYINRCGYELSSIEKKRDKTLRNSDIVLILMLDLKKRRNHAEILSEFSQLEGVHYLEEV